MSFSMTKNLNFFLLSVFFSLKNCSLAIKVHGCRWFFWWHSLLDPLTFLHIIELNFSALLFFSFFSFLALKLSVGNIIFIPLDCNFYLHCSICILSEEKLWRWKRRKKSFLFQHMMVGLLVEILSSFRVFEIFFWIFADSVRWSWVGIKNFWGNFYNLHI